HAHCLVFSSVVCRSSPFTPFPSTTLFRSPDIFQRLAVVDSGQASINYTASAPIQYEADVVDSGQASINYTSYDNLLFSPRVVDSDRKSTRLNSSHVKISYAVFCLKKKKAL